MLLYAACCVLYVSPFGGTASVIVPHVGALRWSPEPRAGLSNMLLIECAALLGAFTLKKLECSKQAYSRYAA